MEKHEMLNALQSGKVVCWCNSNYKVYLSGSELYARYKNETGHYWILSGEYEDCFIANEKY